MSLLLVKIVDIQHDDEFVDIDDLTQTGLEILIHDCERLIEKLEDARANIIRRIDYAG